ncbi:MAG: energy-coupled thiamine transporter ThiT [Bacillota bacterium]|nr:energy-coupled thiamine transporter ThiT [Bacillota bacterium]
MKKSINTALLRLVETGVMLALATVLSVITVYQAPFGGSVTVCSMLPIFIIAYRHGIRWGLLTGAVYGLLQLIIGLNNFSYLHTMTGFIVSFLFDYFVAFGVLGFGGLFKNKIKSQAIGLPLGIIIGCVLRFCCHFISGIAVWGDTAAFQPIWVYSLVYNAWYMAPETIITCVAAVLLSFVLDFRMPKLLKQRGIVN